MAERQYLVLARKWRPQAFEDVVGQDHVTRTLQNAIRAGRVSHAFLFIGSRGIGKTTTARILARALNCSSTDAPTPTPCGTCANCRSIAAGNNIDVIEIDGASNNSVEDVRQIRENVRMVPSSARYKIYVIDEVHQLSSAAFNALLKTLEEPPAHAVFILATTEAHRVPATIVSRCQRYDFRRVRLDDIVTLLRKILESDGVACSDEALHAIARAADGGVRDAESILDQLMSYCGTDISFRDVVDVLGLIDWNVLHELGAAIQTRDVAKLLQIVEEVVVSGKDLSQFVQDIVRYFRNLLVCKTGAPKDLLALPDEEVAEMERCAGAFSLTDLIRLVERFSALSSGFDSQLAQRTSLEAALISISKCSIEVSVDSVLEKLLQMREADGARQAPAMSVTASEPRSTKKKKPEIGREPSSTAAKPVVTSANFAKVWPDIVSEACRDNMGLRVWLEHALPPRIEAGRVVLAYQKDQATSRTLVETLENRAAIEAALRCLTENVTTYRTEVLDEAALRKPPTSPHPASISPLVDVNKYPQIATVVDVFRGRVVDVRPLPPIEENSTDSSM